MEQVTHVKNIEQKINQYKTFLEADPDNPELLLNIGDLYHTISNLEEATHYYEKSLSLSNSNIARSRIGSLKITQHQFNDAESIFKELLQDDQQQPALHYNLGLTQFHLKKWSDSIDNFKMSLDLGNDMNGCLSYLTRCYHHKQELRNARKFCNQWIKESDSTTAKGYMALLEMDSGSPEQALKRANDVLQLDPDNSDAAIVVGTSHIENQDIELAENLFNNVLNNNKDHPRALFGLGLTYMHRQQHDTAIVYMQQASTMMPDDTGMKIAIGWAQITSNQYDDAEKTFQECIDIDRNFAEGHGGLAYIYALKGKMEAAKKEMETALWLDPNSFGAVASKSVIIGYEEGNQKATEFLATALERSPGPGQKAIIEHVQTYVDKYGSQQQEKADS